MILGETPIPPQPLVINGEAVEIVEEFKYLGTILDNRLDCGANTTSLVKKGNQKITPKKTEIMESKRKSKRKKPTGKVPTKKRMVMVMSRKKMN